MSITEHDEGAAQSVSDQAAEWFIRLKDRDLNATERRRYVRWLKQSPGHIAEFMRLCHLYGRVKRAKVPALLRAEAEAESNVIPLMPREPLPAPAPRPRLFDSRRARFAAVACAMALAGVIAGIAFSSNTIETHASEWRTVRLADGSLISAGPNTLLQVDYSKGFRRINLQRGEAMFEVAKDTSRPFIVDAGSAVARAVGTKFGVDRHEDRVRVTVAEGKVAVVRGAQAAALERAVDLSVAIALVQDERVEIPVDAPSVPLQKEKVNSTNALAWARGQLIFSSETLGEAVREFNRRNRIQIQVDDPAIAAWHVCCVFDAADPEAFATLIATDDGIALVREGPNVLRLVPQAPGQPEAAAGRDAI
jgi:transmembrane sensor